MDFMKVLDQTVREIKREVNLKVLKVPEIEQKVLDATDDEPWGPHGTALAEIAQATKKFSECSMVMNVLWSRLSETGRWRYVYKALAVIEYLVSHGAERAVDDIIEHTFQISSLTSFEYVEPNGKDSGINVRKKAENIVALLNNKEKIQEVRNKAAANRDKYIGLSSSGMASKSSFASFTNNASPSTDTYKDSFKDEDKFVKSTSTRPRRGTTGENQGSSSKKSSTRNGADTKSSVSSKTSTLQKTHVKSSVPTQNSSATPSYTEDDFDDFDPRGTSSTKSAAGNSNQADLFGENFVGDLLDFQPSGPEDSFVGNSNSSDVDLFADADFVSAPSHVETGGSPESQIMSLHSSFLGLPTCYFKPTVDLFASKSAFSPPVTSSMDFFAAPEPVVLPEKKSPESDLQNTTAVDPFAAVPLNNFDGSDLFGAFTSTTDSVSTEATKVQDVSHSLSQPELPSKSNTFQVKSGIWADSLSRGLIDLNISAPKKVSLADVGVVGGLSEETDEREKGLPTSYYMGRAMGMGSGISKSGFTSSSGTAGDDDLFSSLGSQQYQFGGFQK